MNEERFLMSIRLRNFLSYGPDAETVELANLNVLIGPNGSGKSNLIEALSVLQATPRDLPKPLREGGGTMEWLWKGSSDTDNATIEVMAGNPITPVPLRYQLEFGVAGQKFELRDELIENSEKADQAEDDVYFYYRFQNGNPVLNTRVEDPESTEKDRYKRTLKRESISLDQSILAQKKDSDLYPEITWLGEQFGSIRLFREWSLGRNTAARNPQLVDLPGDFLLEDAGNLGLVLNDLLHRGLRARIIELLSRFYDGIEDISTKVHGGTIQVYLHEKGLKQPIPATRLSDGTLRYLCLIAILVHPTPPALVCIEEPEIGIHPDILPTVGELLAEASGRCQVIVTTHSDVLVSAFTASPESVLVCEKDTGGTSLRRLEQTDLEHWLENYSLGEVWRMGEIGGNRW